jgi:membrane-associated protein
VFTVWQIAGGLVWSLGLVLGGYLLGSSIPNVDHYLLPAVGVIVALSLVPVALELLKARRKNTGSRGRGPGDAVQAPPRRPAGTRGAHRRVR